jgi:hypothetical protein
MFDDSDALFDALLALRMEWYAIAERYNSHAADLCSGLLASGRLSPGASRERLGDLTLHVIAYDQIMRCIDGVDAVLMDAEDQRMRRVLLGENPPPAPPPR